MRVSMIWSFAIILTNSKILSWLVGWLEVNIERAVEILLFVENYINTFFHILNNSSYALLLGFFL